MTEKTTPAPAEKSKADKFKALAETRTGKALSAIAVIGGLASTTNYEYTDDQVAKIIAALTGEVEVLKNRFANPKAALKSGFSL